jgi:hypothetical protein
MRISAGALQPNLAEAVAAAERIRERHDHQQDCAISRAEAEALLTLDRLQPDSTPLWRDFVATAIAGHIVAAEPAGLLDGEKGEWLMCRVAPEGRLESALAFEAMLRAFERTRETAPRLSAFAIRQLCAACINGEGALIGERVHFSRTVDAEDAAMLHRMLVAAGGAEGRPVSREEAEALFDLHDATARSQNDTAFNDLFYRAIANYVLAASGHALEPRKEALSTEYVLSARLRPSPEQVSWLSERIMRDGQPTLPEFELLLLIGSEPLKTDTSLQRLLAI